ncbi:MAG TPA: cytochrome c biogenesis protein [Coriobacteriia bacterium]|nr:cytochrome c biogenesis protein [Coriobacteriia bacterium]
MFSRSNRIFFALILGGLLTLGAFIGTFFVAGVPDFGTVLLPEKADTVRYRGPVEEEFSTEREFGYLKNRLGFAVDVKPADGGEVVSGTLLEANDTAMTVEVPGGSETLQLADIKSVHVAGYEYGRPDWGQKIFYFHVSVAEISFLIFAFAAYYAIRFITTRKREYDIKARISMETTLVFVTLTMLTGILWTKAAWGVWWDWEPRLTTYFIMTLLVIAYFVLRNSVEDEERRALYAAAFSILAFIDAPISFFITRLIPSSHPVIERGGLEPPMLISFIVAQIGMILLGYAVYQLRMGEVLLRERLEQAKADLERW